VAVLVCSALFLLRDPSFIDDVPEEHRKDFVDSDRLAPYKLKILKQMIQDRFPVCTAVCSVCEAGRALCKTLQLHQ